MKMIRNIFLASLVMLTIFSCSKKSVNLSEVRLGQFLLTEKTLQITFSGEGIKLEKDLDYGTLTDYFEIPSGKYTVEIRSDSITILKKILGMGANGKYTLFAQGIVPTNPKLNQETVGYKLHKISQGEEAKTANGGLPQLTVLNDDFETAQDEAKIRWIHLATGTVQLSASCFSEKDTVQLPSLSYPQISKSIAIAPEQNHISWKLKGSEIETISTNINSKKEHLYTIFVIGNPSHYINKMTAVTGITEKKHSK